MPRKVLVCVLGEGKRWEEGGKEAVVNSCTGPKGLSPVNSPSQDVGRTGWPNSKILCPSSEMSEDRQEMGGHTNRAANF